jgi:hypothetical protein
MRKYLVVKSTGLGFETASFYTQRDARASVVDWFGDYIIFQTKGLVKVIAERHQ